MNIILAETVISEFTNRFVQAERASIVPLVTLVSLLLALLVLPRLTRMLQRGDANFNTSLWRWGLGILFTFLFPSFLSVVILNKPISEIIIATPVQPALDQSGYVPEDRKQYWVRAGQQEKATQKITPFNGFQNSQLGTTVINPSADPARFGEDLWYPTP